MGIGVTPRRCHGPPPVAVVTEVSPRPRTHHPVACAFPAKRVTQCAQYGGHRRAGVLIDECNAALRVARRNASRPVLVIVFDQVRKTHAARRASPEVGALDGTVISALDAQTSRSLDEVAAAAVNTNYTVQAGLDPAKDAILQEDPQGPYVNVIAVRAVDKDQPWVKTLVESYRSPEVKAFMADTFKSFLPSWWVRGTGTAPAHCGAGPHLQSDSWTGSKSGSLIANAR
jgi:hypothetical protein